MDQKSINLTSSCLAEASQGNGEIVKAAVKVQSEGIHRVIEIGPSVSHQSAENDHINLPKAEQTILHKREALESKNDGREWIYNVQTIVAVVGSLITVAYSGVLSPPGSVYQDGLLAGKAIMSNTIRFRVFKFCNDLALFSCLALIAFLISFISTKQQVLISLLSSAIYKFMWACISFTAAAYISASWVISIPGQSNQTMLVIVTMVLCALLGSVFVGLPLLQLRIRQRTPSIPEQSAQEAGPQ